MKKLVGAFIALALGAGIIYLAPTAVAAVGLGYGASCHNSVDKCTSNEGDCTLTGYTPTIVQDPADPLNSLLKVRGMVACDTPKAALKIGPSALYRYDCAFAPLGGWHCNNKTDVGLDNGHFHVSTCGKGNDAPSCVPWGWKYTSGQVIFFYDLKDKEEGQVTCHSFTQELNGAFWATDPNDLPRSISPEVDTYGQFYGDPSNGQPCTGRRG